jgi:hypothetical protein
MLSVLDEIVQEDRSSESIVSISRRMAKTDQRKVLQYLSTSYRDAAKVFTNQEMYQLSVRELRKDGGDPREEPKMTC